jgi:hypothetical protein
MKSILLAQFIVAFLLIFLTAGMMIAAFLQNADFSWKAFTVYVFIFSILFVRQTYKELKS